MSYIMYICVQGFFKFLEENTGLEAVNLSNAHSIRDVLYIEVCKHTVTMLFCTCMYYTYVDSFYTTSIFMHVIRKHLPIFNAAGN